MNRLGAAYSAIDAANSDDPTVLDVGGARLPAEVVYGQRMTETLERLDPAATEALKLAVRAQHIRRWTVPRDAYPMDRTGYLRWRTDLKRKHADWAGEILATIGYAPAEIARVGSLIRKERLKQDPEAQALEDVAAVVFLEHYALDFAAKHEPAKVVAILAKTLAKMSDRGRELALASPLPPEVRELVLLATEELAAAPRGRPT